MSADVELLREAATRMREQANAASADQRWSAGEEIDGVFCHQYGDFGFYVTGPAGSPEFEDSEQGKADASHVAAWDPAVALRVAVWLEEAATELERHIPAWTRPSGGVDDPPARCWNNPERLAATIEHHYGCALAVARAYLHREDAGVGR